jgi:hypothetical protein
VSAELQLESQSEPMGVVRNLTQHFR